MCLKEERSWVSSLYFAEIPPPHSSRDKGPHIFDCRGRPTIGVSVVDFCGISLPIVRREESASLTPAAKGHQMPIFNPRVSALEYDLEIPAITALK